MRKSITDFLSRWSNLNPILRLGILALVLGAAAIAVLPPSWRTFRKLRIENNLQNARVAIGEERMLEARDLSLTVLRSGDPRIEAFRILEKSALSLRDPRHGEIAVALLFHADSTDEDKLQGFLGIVTQLPLGLVGRAWAQMPESLQKDPRFAAPFGERLAKEKRIGEAGMVLLGVPEEKRDKSILEGVIRVLIESGSHESYAEAQRRIAASFSEGSIHLPGWLDLLDDIPPQELDSSILAPVRARLAEAPDDPSQALMLARIDSNADSSQRVQVIEAAIDKWREPAPVELAQFLSTLGLHQELLNRIAASQIGERKDLMKSMLDAAAKTADWQRFAILLENHGQLLTEIELATYRTAHAAAIVNSSAHKENWDNAMRMAAESKDDDALLLLQSAASSLNLTSEAEQAMVAAIRRGRGPLPLYSALKPMIQSLATSGQEKILLEIGAIYLSFEPGNPVLITQYAYLACLSELIEPPMAIQAIERLAKAMPDELAVHFTLAAAHLCDGRADLAAAVIEKWKADETKLPPAFRAIAITTRFLNEEITKDDPAIRDFPSKQLLPTERRRFNEWLRELPRSGGEAPQSPE